MNNLVLNPLNHLRTLVGVATLALLSIGSTTVAHANLVTDGTYMFTSTDGHNSLDGSWVKWSGDAIVDWYLQDIHANDYSPYPPNNLPLTPANSELDPQYIFGGALALEAWAFRIIGTVNPDVNYYDFFSGQNNLFGPGVGGGMGALYDGFGDPEGNWALSTDVNGIPTPDSSSTFSLALIGLTALATCKSFMNYRSTRR